MDSLNKDELFSISKKLNLKDLSKFCMCNRRIRENVWLQNDIWRFHLTKHKNNINYIIKLIMLDNDVLHIKRMLKHLIKILN